MNKVIILGRLTSDPEIKSTPAGLTVASFSVATSEKYKDKQGQMQEKTEFHNIVAWKKLAEIVGQYCRKGNRIMVEGKLQTRNWEGQDGKKIYRTETIANNINIIDFPKKENENQEEAVLVDEIPF